MFEFIDVSIGINKQVLNTEKNEVCHWNSRAVFKKLFLCSRSLCCFIFYSFVARCSVLHQRR